MPRVPYIEYDYRYMLHEHIHEAGISKKGFAAMCRDLHDVQDMFNKRGAWNPKRLLLGADKEGLKKINNLAKTARETARTMIVIGVGGSDLGARALFGALEEVVANSTHRVRFVGATTDPYAIERDMADIDFLDSTVVVVSKSGETIETLATFFVVLERLKATVGDKRISERVIVVTGNDGQLRAIAEEEGFAIIEIPEEIGGRFSVFTACALLPAAFAGIKIEKCVIGAEKIINETIRSLPEHCAPMLFAGLHVQAYMDQRINTTILMPYNEQLRMFGHWFRQLWAESLGKSQNRKGGMLNFGLMPILAMGPTDQHSQLQLYLDGPANNIVTFLMYRKQRHEQRLSQEKIIPAILRGKKFSEMLNVEHFATAQTLAESGRTNATLFIEKPDEEHVGALFAFFMCATVTVGELLDIDVFNQPAVEAIKQKTLKVFHKQKKGGELR